MKRFNPWLVLLGLAVCAGVVQAGEPLVFWTPEVEKDRMELQEELGRAFQEKTGIAVKVVPVQENMLSERVTAAFAARSLPDVIYHPIDYTHGWLEAGVLNAQAATSCIDALGKATFGKGPLRLVDYQGACGAVPMDGWGQLLLFRKDLFKEKGLAEPDSWDAILEAARTLHNPPLLWGFEAATDPGQTYTQQVFEHFALSNGVRLTGAHGQIHLNSSRLKETLEFYKTLAGFTPPGNLYWLHTRLDYLSGRTAMIVWSPYILDELSGLRQDQPVVPDLAKGKAGFLAQNTGFVSVIKGPNGAAQYGQVSYLGITRDADVQNASQWVNYLLGEGYPKWMGMAPEGKLPLRKGTAEDEDRFVQEWMGLEFGVTRRARISDFYGKDVVQKILEGMDGFDRWGFAAGKGGLMSKIYGTKVVPKVLKQYLDGELSEEEAARELESRIRSLE